MSGTAPGETPVIAVLGSTGSVGRQTLEVAARQGFAVDLLTAHRDVATMEAQARAFLPRTVVMADPAAAGELKTRLADTPVRVLSGADAIPAAIGESRAATFVNAILGEAGLLPTLAVLDTGRRLALANKESLVVAGEIVMRRARERGAELLPVDSEHSAIFQCLSGGRHGEVKRLLLTASGGPFYGYTREQLAAVRVEDTLRHPTWHMGAKITVDSATLMNKGFEIIEAAHLFGVTPDRITVLVHPESIIHSAVEYIDNTVLAELSKPDMRACIQHALTYPARVAGLTGELDLFSVGSLTFRAPDPDTFPLLPLAKRAFSDGGAMPAVVNAANEVAVAAFLAGDISFLRIFDTVETTYARMGHAARALTLDEILSMDREARRVAAALTER